MASSALWAHVKLIFIIALGFLTLYTLTDVPYISILVLDLLICIYLVNSFKEKYKYLFFLHPLILYISSQLYVTPFLEAGDGNAYRAVVTQYLNTTTLEFDAGALLSTHGFFGFLKIASLGVAPIYAIPEFFFENPGDSIYYVWQSTFHIFLCSVVVTVAKAWKILDLKYLLCMALFAIISPSFFELTATPTRHVVTFFGIFLLIISHIAVVQRITVTRVIWFGVAIGMVLISKAPLLIPYMIFMLIDLIFIRSVKVNANNALILCVATFGIFLMGGYFYETIWKYMGIATSGAATFSWLVQVPIIGWVVKYVYAFLSPFPWSDAPHFIEIIYAGNELLFVMHALSSLIGIYLFLILICKWREILASKTELKQLIAYSVIMSLSILMGSIGFHTYLLIYFPMLAPLLSERRFLINPIFAVLFVASIETLVVIGRSMYSM